MAKLTPVGALGKWVLAPLALILIGYFLVGPKIGRSTGNDSKDQQSSNGSQSPDPSSPTQPSANQPAAPDVDVTVQKSDGPAPEQVKPRHRPRKVDQKPDVAQKPLTKPDQATPPDEGGSAGSTTAGGQA
jgi:hypothetical protein